MHTTPNPFDLQTITACWQAFDAVAHVHPIRSLDDYERMVALMDSLLAATGDGDVHLAISNHVKMGLPSRRTSHPSSTT